MFRATNKTFAFWPIQKELTLLPRASAEDGAPG
jgi:hypothetical protein